MISIIIVDDDPEITKTLKKLVNSTGIAKVVATATSGLEALEAAIIYHPDLIMLDVILPEVTGFEIARDLADLSSDTRILAMSSHKSAKYVRGMLNAGASGYMIKDNALTETKTAIQAVMDGVKWIGQGVAET